MLREMKQKAPDIPVVYLAGLSSEDAAISAFRAGAREYFKKPVAAWELRAVIQGLLKTKRSSWEKRSAFVRTGEQEPGACMRTADGNEPYSVVRAVDYIEANLTADIDLDELAKAARVSKYHFCRIFKRCIGVSPLQYVATARIERAKAILRRAGAPVSVVSNMSGFRDISTFIRQFKRQTGMTPSAFRRSRPDALLHK
jgi:AraC-like DNA-binding protein